MFDNSILSMKAIEIEFDLGEIDAAVKKFSDETKNAHVLAFSGELGAGKTTFISKYCEQLGVSDIVNSPTFAIVQQYVYPGGNIFHMDLYRIHDEEEAANAGLVDCIDSGDLCLVEWPEKAPGILPEDAILTRIHITGPDRRRLEIHIPSQAM